MNWADKIAEYTIPIIGAAVVAIARWVYAISRQTETHKEQLKEVLRQQIECKKICCENRERMALSEQDREFLHGALGEVRGDVKRILWYIRTNRNKGEEDED